MINPVINSTWWFIPLSKWVITPIISGLTLLIPCITGVITHLRAVGSSPPSSDKPTASPHVSLMFLKWCQQAMNPLERLICHADSITRRKIEGILGEKLDQISRWCPSLFQCWLCENRIPSGYDGILDMNGILMGKPSNKLGSWFRNSIW